MPDRFCSQCGAELMPRARFCAGCGRHSAGGSWRPVPLLLGRFAPLAIFGSVLLVTGVAAIVGHLNPAEAPSVPGRSGTARGSGGSAAMPEGHPPIAIPEDVKQVIADLRKAAEAAPDDAEAWTKLANVQYRAGLIEPAYLAAAEASYRHLLERAPKDLETLRMLGNIAFDRRDPATAVEYYQRYLAEKPADLNVQTDMATMIMGRGDTDDAIRMYEKVLAQKPDFFQALFNLGIAHHTRGDAGKSLAFFDKARAVAPDERSRAQVDQVLASVRREPPVPPAAEDAESAPFRTAVESVFRTHQMIGPKIERIEWRSETAARVIIRDFPINAMPDEVLQRFTDRVRDEVKEKKSANGVAAPVSVELVDASTASVMQTIVE